MGQGGSFFEPTVLTDVATDMVATKEETFGPVAPRYRAEFLERHSQHGYIIAFMVSIPPSAIS
jgi:acyl-CoA reductase-like NAD-dependent aldehyde dehydrogenase